MHVSVSWQHQPLLNDPPTPGFISPDKSDSMIHHHFIIPSISPILSKVSGIATTVPFWLTSAPLQTWTSRGCGSGDFEWCVLESICQRGQFALKSPQIYLILHLNNMLKWYKGSINMTFLLNVVNNSWFEFDKILPRPPAWSLTIVALTCADKKTSPRLRLYR